MKLIKFDKTLKFTNPVLLKSNAGVRRFRSTFDRFPILNAIRIISIKSLEWHSTTWIRHLVLFEFRTLLKFGRLIKWPFKERQKQSPLPLLQTS